MIQNSDLESVKDSELIKTEFTSSEDYFLSKKNVQSSTNLVRFYLPIEDYNKSVEEYYAHKQWSFSTLSGSTNTELSVNIVGHYTLSEYKSFHQIIKTSFTSAYNLNNSLNVLADASGGLLISIPYKFIGEGIQKNLFEISITTGSNSFTLRDDGKGNLYRTAGSSTVQNLTGSVFYNNGLVYIPSKGSMNLNFETQFIAGDSITLSFNSTLSIREQIWKCNIPEGEFNFSQNTTALYSGGNNHMRMKFPSSSFQPYITSIGLYNKQNDLIAFAKLARPLKKYKNLDTTILIQLNM